MYYGGSNIGGAIKFISTRPSPDETSGRLKLMVGEQNSIDIEGSINIPIGDDWAQGYLLFQEKTMALCIIQVQMTTA